MRGLTWVGGPRARSWPAAEQWAGQSPCRSGWPRGCPRWPRSGPRWGLSEAASHRGQHGHGHGEPPDHEHAV